MQMLHEHPWYADGNAQRLTSFAFVLIAVIAAIDSVLIPDVGLGFLYFIPLCVAAAFMSRWQILIVATICTIFSEAFSSFPAGPDRIPRVFFGFLSYTFVAVMIREMAVFSRAASRRLNEIEQEVSLRHRAEEQLEMLINSSPAGIVAVSADGKIVVSNEAAHQMFAVAPGGLTGQPIATFLPMLDHMEVTQPRATIQCRCLRSNGESFAAFVAVSTFTSAAGLTTAAIFVDGAKAPPSIDEVGQP
jgi:two-component system, LuxR family, sensor kinase FixL